MVSLNCSMSKRARSSIPQFRVRVPAKVVAQLRGKRVLLSLGNESDRPFIKTVTIGSDVSFSLETDDRLIAESRQANALDHFRRLFELTEADPVSLSHRDLVALRDVSALSGNPWRQSGQAVRVVISQGHASGIARRSHQESSAGHVDAE